MSKVTPTERDSRVSGSPSSIQPGWAPPRSPLPPHRLAKIANALGVSMPSPATPNSSTPYLSPSFSGGSPSASNADLPWRVTTPSIASTHNIGSFASSSQSKFLLHVIPPLHLLHDFDASDPSEHALPPSTASGYHTQFRRGTLVALQPSLQAQLIAIAKEYALPSTIGLILYLITISPQSRQSSPMPFATPASGNEDAEEPGPRLSEEIWKHIWGRLSYFHGDQPPVLTGLGLGLDSSGHSNLRPLLTPLRTETPQPQPLAYPITPSSTASSVSDIRSHSKSAALSSSSITPSEPDTPDTSRLNSASIIPILAKVEFDIDRRRAVWYEPWLRGRRMTHAKRAESRQSNRARSQSRAEGDGDGKRMPFDLRLVERMQNASSVLSFTASQSSREEGGTGGYTPLSDSTDEAVGEDAATHVTDVCHHDPLVDEDTATRVTDVSHHDPLVDEDTSTYVTDVSHHDPLVDEDTATHVTDVSHRDPLVDVFGTDADAWADMRAESPENQREVNPNVVELALDASALTALSEHEVSGDEVDDAEEVLDIMRRMSKPPLTLSIPPLPGSQQISSTPSSPKSQQISLPTTTNAKKSVPPPLVFAPKEASNDLLLHIGPSPMLSSSSGRDSTSLPCATPRGMPITDETGNDDGLSLAMEQEYMRSRSPTEEKRGGAVFEDLNLGLDLGDEDEEYDENDPNDRRRSQYLMRAKLDEIERTLAQFSPRQLKTDDLDDEDITITHARSKSLLALHAGVIPKLSTDHIRDIPARGNSNINGRVDASEKSWPAVSYSFIANKVSQSPSLQSHRPADLPPSPPRLAVNGVSTGAPKSFAPPSRSASPNSFSTETKIRKRDLESSIYPPPLLPSFGRQSDMSSDSPIPLSPDPFGRYPSYPESESQSTPTYWDPATGQFTSIPAESRPSVDEGSVASTTPSSRFSADSASFSMDAAVNTAKTSPLVSVKTFKKLWRRSKSTSVSQPPTPSAGRTSFQVSAPPVLPLHDQTGPPPPPQRVLPPVPATAMSRPSLTRTPSPTTPSSEKTSVRKSILKTWKSVSGATASSSTPSEPKRDTERPVSNETIKPRRPSILDAGVPPTPKLAEHYLHSNHARTGSGSGIFERRKSAGRSKMGPSSNFSTSSQDVAFSRTSSSMQPPSPARSLQSATSRYSQVDGSFETAQYELITPPRVYPNLSYPYQTLDQD
ncbi:uncharacterized protein EDB91DRAFT_1095537 [Suillus paluster]|uniref:uncharacterized protein n=1 Tax=Suillus paluster TaxID=48578 RepID=UPI001B878998|nr:uncharacterized protein EDB91DRAFT_1095537 [Suillus paluster]KAG1754775.1 hypothetical protein EDB91DRAFT_1095537 [Suillus paluster]